MTEVKEQLGHQGSISEDIALRSKTLKHRCVTTLYKKDHDIAVILYYAPNDGHVLCAAYRKHLRKHMPFPPQDIFHFSGGSQTFSKEHPSMWCTHCLDGLVARRDAQKFVAEHEFLAWVQRENDLGGVALTTRRICGEHNDATVDVSLPDGMAPVSAGGPLSKHMKQWTHRWHDVSTGIKEFCPLPRPLVPAKEQRMHIRVGNSTNKTTD